jgi:hypothetical protein
LANKASIGSVSVGVWVGVVQDEIAIIIPDTIVKNDNFILFISVLLKGSGHEITTKRRNTQLIKKQGNQISAGAGETKALI